MITDAQSQGDLIAALHLESLFNSGHMPHVADDAVQLRGRLAFIQTLAVNAQGLFFKTNTAAFGANEKSSAAAY
jgi:hypothetical protein